MTQAINNTDYLCTSSCFSLANFSKLLCLAVFVLIFFGALVTSNNAGLAVPDWPTSFGYNMFLFPPSQWIGGIFYEHVHRLVASLIGLLTVVLAVWTARVDPRPLLRKLSWLAVLLVVFQGVLGGLTVHYKLPLLISASHGVLGQSFLILVLVIAYLHSDEYRLRATNKEGYYSLSFRLALLSALCVYWQLIIGALMRHSESGLAAPDFPLTGANWLPDLSQNGLDKINVLRHSLHLPAVDILQFTVHVAHRFSGYLAACFIFLLVSHTVKIARVRGISICLAIIVILQVSLGALTILTGRHPLITSLHVLGGALLLALSVLMVLRLLPLKFHNKI